MNVTDMSPRFQWVTRRLRLSSACINPKRPRAAPSAPAIPSASCRDRPPTRDVSRAVDSARLNSSTVAECGEEAWQRHSLPGRLRSMVRHVDSSRMYRAKAGVADSLKSGRSGPRSVQILA